MQTKIVHAGGGVLHSYKIEAPSQAKRALGTHFCWNYELPTKLIHVY